MTAALDADNTTPAAHAALPVQTEQPRRVLMTLDAVGGVWRYAMDLAAGLRSKGVEVVFAGLGPAPSSAQSREAVGIGTLIWLNAALDWMVEDERKLDAIPGMISDLVREHGIDLVHVNLPSQAAGLRPGVPVVAMSHSCVVTWFEAVRKSAVPADWLWQERLNRLGFDAADAVLAPSGSHAAALTRCYGAIDRLDVVHNATAVEPALEAKEDFVFAAGRWWDDGKNGTVIDRAASQCDWRLVMAGAARGPNGQTFTASHAHFMDELPHGEAMALMRRAGIVASPSLYEPFGLAALEAARTGAALVLADIPTYRELWNGAALFADPQDPAAFAEAINRLSRDGELRADLGTLAQLRSREFTQEAQAAATLDLYSRVLGQARHTAMVNRS